MDPSQTSDATVPDPLGSMDDFLRALAGEIGVQSIDADVPLANYRIDVLSLYRLRSYVESRAGEAFPDQLAEVLTTAREWYEYAVIKAGH